MQAIILEFSHCVANKVSNYSQVTQDMIRVIFPPKRSPNILRLKLQKFLPTLICGFCVNLNQGHILNCACSVISHTSLPISMQVGYRQKAHSPLSRRKQRKCFQNICTCYSSKMNSGIYYNQMSHKNVISMAEARQTTG